MNTETSHPERSTTFFRFEDLRVYHKSLEYISLVHNITEGIDAVNNNNILEIFNQSARSITINIAEGSARNKSQFIYYLKLAKSAIRDCLVYTTALNNQGLLEESQETDSRNYLMEMTKMTGALISSLQKAYGGKGEHEEHDPPERHREHLPY
jgi:four helix bundle protein